jgi:hypothetical protein
MTYPSKTVDGVRQCGCCKEQLPVASFNRRKRGTGSYQTNCKKCVGELWKTAKQSGPEVRRRYQLQRKYGVNEQSYFSLWNQQNGVCAICGNEETARYKGTLKMLAVDHDHETGVIRGLLCQECNTGIGKFRHDQDLLVKASEYVNLRLRILAAS